MRSLASDPFHDGEQRGEEAVPFIRREVRHELVERDFVTRRESTEDRRSRLIALSDYGREVVDRLTRARLATLDTFVAEITPEERAGLLAALLPIVERIKSSD